MSKHKTLALVLFMFFSLMLSGCSGKAATTATTIPADITIDSRYKAMTGKVVAFGTSIWAIERGPTGIASRFEQMTSFKVTDNCYLGGMAVRLENDYFTDVSLESILFYDDNKYNIEKRNSIYDADYVILAYGGNDQSRGVPASGEGQSFENAMRRSVAAIKQMNPKAHIILIAPLNGWVLIDGEYVQFKDIDEGGGKLNDYIDAVERIAKDENLLCVNMNDVISFSKDDPKKYFEDGAHLTELGRKIYAQYLTEKIYERYNNSDRG